MAIRNRSQPESFEHRVGASRVDAALDAGKRHELVANRRSEQLIVGVLHYQEDIVRALPGNRDGPVDAHVPQHLGVHAGQAFEQRGLARPVRRYDAGDVPGLEARSHVAQHLVVAVVLRDDAARLKRRKRRRRTDAKPCDEIGCARRCRRAQAHTGAFRDRERFELARGPCMRDLTLFDEDVPVGGI